MSYRFMYSNLIFKMIFACKSRSTSASTGKKHEKTNYSKKLLKKYNYFSIFVILLFLKSKTFFSIYFLFRHFFSKKYNKIDLKKIKLRRLIAQ